MPWTVSYDEKLQIVELILTGKFTDQDIMAAASARIALGTEHGAKNFVIDATDFELSGSMLSIYDVSATLYDEKRVERSVRIAVLSAVDSPAKEVVAFYEDVSVNRGWNVMSFHDRENAVEWLLEKRASVSTSFKPG